MKLSDGSVRCTAQCGIDKKKVHFLDQEVENRDCIRKCQGQQLYITK